MRFLRNLIYIKIKLTQTTLTTSKASHKLRDSLLKLKKNNYLVSNMRSTSESYNS